MDPYFREGFEKEGAFNLASVGKTVGGWGKAIAGKAKTFGKAVKSGYNAPVKNVAKNVAKGGAKAVKGGTKAVKAVKTAPGGFGTGHLVGAGLGGAAAGYGAAKLTTPSQQSNQY